MNKDEMRDQIEKAKAEFKGKITKLDPEFAIRSEQTRFARGNEYAGYPNRMIGALPDKPRIPPKRVHGNEVAVQMHLKAQKKAIRFKLRTRKLNEAEKLRNLTNIY